MSADLETNLRTARALVQRFEREPLPHFIGGRHDAGRSGATFENLTPVDNSIIGRVTRGNDADVAAACAAASAAFADWKRYPASKRRKLLHAIADAIVARADEIALVESYDTGQPIRFMSKAAVRGAENFRFFADKVPGARDGLALPARRASELHAAPASRSGRRHHAVEHAVHALDMEDRSRARGRLHGRAQACRMVTAHGHAARRDLPRGRPSGRCAESRQRHRRGSRQGLTEHAAIKAVAFVGESATGAQIMRQGAPTLKRVHFELGGKNPVIVFDDADLDRALDAAVFMIYSLNGERCTSSSRLLVQASIHDEFVAKVAERARRIRVGHPLDPETEVGPLIHPRHLEKVVGFFELATAGRRDDRGRGQGRADRRQGQLRGADALRRGAQLDARSHSKRSSARC